MCDLNDQENARHFSGTTICTIHDLESMSHYDNGCKNYIFNGVIIKNVNLPHINIFVIYFI